MDDTSKTLKPWVTFAGCVLVVVVLYWAQAVLVPFAVAILLTFVLTPPVTWLRALGWPRPGRSRGGHAGVRGSRSRRLGSGAADGPSGRRPSRATAPTSWRRSRTCAARAREDRSRSCRRRSKTSRPTLENRMRPKERSRGPSWSPLTQVTGFSGFTWLAPDRRPVGNGGVRGGDGHLHAARTPGSARPADRPVRAWPAGHHDEGV